MKNKILKIKKEELLGERDKLPGEIGDNGDCSNCWNCDDFSSYSYL